MKSIKLSDEYSWRSHSQSELNEFYFEVEPIKNSVYKYHFRHQRDGQIIDIYSDNGKVFSGELINSIIQYKDIKTDYGTGSKANSYIYQSIQLNTDSATKVGAMILNQKFYSTPTDTLIAGWNFGWLDCGSISFSFKVQNNFKVSEYTCHRLQNDSINYVTSIKTMYDTIGQILDLQNKYSEFEPKLDKGKTYSKNGFVMMYIMSEKQSLAFQKSKPQREYLKSIKDTVDTYLKAEIVKQKIEFSEIDCIEDYQLTFNKNGKLKDVKVSNYDKPKLSDGLDFYFEEKREIRKCKKLIKQIFKEIDMSSFNMKFKIYRTLSFGLENEAQLSDNMIY
ncbi:hypothetical protein AVL50_09970 [Flammeovirga sp. SJP92]|nr:hypothetical protein AVL50_09970 [Flammeovirga sp. SJP92]